MSANSLDNSTKLYDVIVIGGGPAGLSAALYAARAQLATVVLDKNFTAGALGTTDKIENYPGVPRKLTGAELLSMFREQAKSFGAHIVETPVVGIQSDKDLKQVMTAEGVYKGKTVIVATGSMGRSPTLNGEEEFMGRGVSYCAACDAPFFRDKEVAIIGDIKEILEEMDPIATFARTLYVIPKGTITSEQKQILASISKATVLPDHRVVRISGERTVTGVVIVDSEGNEQTFAVSGVFIYLHGNQPITDFLQGTVELTADGCIKVNPEDMSTSVEGIYAAGDVTCKKFRQAVIATAEGCIAALSAEKYITKRKGVRPQWG